MKYIRFKKISFVRDTILTFDKGIPHYEMVNALRADEYGVVSAGFVRNTPEGLECYGESIGLGTQSQPDDTDLLRKQMHRPEDTSH